MADPLSSVPSPAEIERMVREVTMAVQRGDIAAAEAVAVRGVEAGSEHPFLLKVKALALHNRGEFRDALRAFHHARVADPNDPSTLNGIAGCLAAIGEYRAAIEMVEASLELAPDAQPTHYLRGWILQQAGEFQAARSSYGRALALGQNDPAVLAALAAVAVALEDFDTARARAHQALAIDPRQMTALGALAAADIGQGKAKDIEPRLRGALQASLQPQIRAQLLSFLGDALDAQGRSTEAFAVWLQKVEETHRTSSTVNDPLADFAAAFRGVPSGAWQDDAPAGGPTAPIFVTGAGTEILAPVLAELPTVLRARGSLNEFVHQYLAVPDGIGRLADVKGADLAEMREAYWTTLNAGEDPRVIVEQAVRYPLDLPLIAKLFPGARVLVHVRDPRDAVLEAFRHQANDGICYTLAQCAKAYATVLSFAEDCRAVLPLDIHDVRNEDLVADYEIGVRNTLTELGLDEPPELPKPLRRVQKATGLWRRYKAEMSQVLPELTEWAEKLGYPTD